MVIASKLLTVLIFFLFTKLPVAAQECDVYVSYVKVANNLAQKGGKGYTEAIAKLNELERICPGKKKEVASLKKQMQARIDSDKKAANKVTAPPTVEKPLSVIQFPPYDGFHKIKYYKEGRNYIGEYEGYYLNYQRWGQGKFTLENGDILEGYWSNDMFLFGILSYANGNGFEGSFSGGKKNGWGTYWWSETGAFQGEWTNDKRNGIGLLYLEKRTYLGEYKNNVFHGFGILEVDSGFYMPGCPGLRSYFGQWYEGKKEGFARCYDAQKRLIYEGRFSDDKPSSPFPNVPLAASTSNINPYADEPLSQGEVYNRRQSDGIGRLEWKDPDSVSNYYAGQWISHEAYGYGEWGNKYKEYKGEWQYGRKNGLGTLMEFAGNRFIYFGKWKHNKQDGSGIQYTLENEADIPYCKGCIRYVGEWKDGKKNGPGRCYDKNNKLIFEGYFVDDKPVNYPFN